VQLSSAPLAAVAFHIITSFIRRPMPWPCRTMSEELFASFFRPDRLLGEHCYCGSLWVAVLLWLSRRRLATPAASTSLACPPYLDPNGCLAGRCQCAARLITLPSFGDTACLHVLSRILPDDATLSRPVQEAGRRAADTQHRRHRPAAEQGSRGGPGAAAAGEQATLVGHMGCRITYAAAQCHAVPYAFDQQLGCRATALTLCSASHRCAHRLCACRT